MTLSDNGSNDESTPNSAEQGGPSTKSASPVPSNRQVGVALSKHRFSITIENDMINITSSLFSHGNMAYIRMPAQGRFSLVLIGTVNKGYALRLQPLEMTQSLDGDHGARNQGALLALVLANGYGEIEAAWRLVHYTLMDYDFERENAKKAMDEAQLVVLNRQGQATSLPQAETKNLRAPDVQPLTAKPPGPAPMQPTPTPAKEAKETTQVAKTERSGSYLWVVGMTVAALLVGGLYWLGGGHPQTSGQAGSSVIVPLN